MEPVLSPEEDHVPLHRGEDTSRGKHGHVARHRDVADTNPALPNVPLEPGTDPIHRPLAVLGKRSAVESDVVPVPPPVISCDVTPTTEVGKGFEIGGGQKDTP